MTRYVTVDAVRQTLADYISEWSRACERPDASGRDPISAWDYWDAADELSTLVEYGTATQLRDWARGDLDPTTEARIIESVGAALHARPDDVRDWVIYWGAVARRDLASAEDVGDTPYRWALASQHCADCGAELTRILDDETGWCYECSMLTPVAQHAW